MVNGTKTAVILISIIIISIIFISTLLSTVEKNRLENQTIFLDTVDKTKFQKVPELKGITGFINIESNQIEKKIKDKVVVYDFWTYSCINCIRTLPYLTSWYNKYSDEGLIIIGIHSPEFEFEKDIKNVKLAVEKHGIKYPVLLDNNMETWKAFGNRYWPTKYIVDHEGYIRYSHIGEGKYEETEQVIRSLLYERAEHLGEKIEKNKPLTKIEEFNHTIFRTPEIYFGYKYAQGRNQLGNQEGFKPGAIVDYDIPENLKQDYFYLKGKWSNLPASMKLISKEGEIILPFHAKQVNIVAGNNAELVIFLDNRPISPEYMGNDVLKSGKVVITEHTLYNIINTKNADSHVLKIKVKNPGFEIYTFTFG